MSIYLLSVDKDVPPWVHAAVTHYQKKLPPRQRFINQTVHAAATKNQTIASAQKEEAKRLLQHIPQHSYVIALVIAATPHTSEYWADTIKHLCAHHPHLCFIIGGTYGLHADCLKKAHQQWSLSSLTFSHTLARIVLAEQIFRSRCIQNNHPYHQPT
jgi:23S rRNA (pseudouridine1915-N3)-methyltransferase